MTPKIVNVRPAGGFLLKLSFSDGLIAVVDFTKTILNRPGLWKALADESYFRQVRVDHELESIVWPNGIDICPEILYAMAAEQAGHLAEPAEKVVAD